MNLKKYPRQGCQRIAVKRLVSDILPEKTFGGIKNDKSF
jgi:hypothetical protein